MNARLLRAMFAIVAFGTVAAISQGASAAPYTYISKAATAVYRPSVYLTAGSHSVSTTNSRAVQIRYFTFLIHRTTT